MVDSIEQVERELRRSRNPEDWQILADLLEDQTLLCETEPAKERLEAEAAAWRELSQFATLLLPVWCKMVAPRSVEMIDGERWLQVIEIKQEQYLAIVYFKRTPRQLRITITTGTEASSSSQSILGVYTPTAARSWLWDPAVKVSFPADEMRPVKWKLLRFKLWEMLQFIRDCRRDERTKQEAGSDRS